MRLGEFECLQHFSKLNLFCLCFSNYKNAITNFSGISTCLFPSYFFFQLTSIDAPDSLLSGLQPFFHLLMRFSRNCICHELLWFDWWHESTVSCTVSRRKRICSYCKVLFSHRQRLTLLPSRMICFGFLTLSFVEIQ